MPLPKCNTNCQSKGLLEKHTKTNHIIVTHESARGSPSKALAVHGLALVALSIRSAAGSYLPPLFAVM